MELFLGESSSEALLLQLLVSYLRLDGKVNVISLSKGALKAITLNNLVLKVPSLVISTGAVLTSRVDIIRYLIGLTVWEDVLLGKSEDEKKQIDQIVNRHQTVQTDTIQNLQKFLEPKTFAVSNHITFADLHLFALLHSKVTQLADNEKNQFNNVYRWFKHIQSLDGVHDYLAKTNRGIARDAHVSVQIGHQNHHKKKK